MVNEKVANTMETIVSNGKEQQSSLKTSEKKLLACRHKCDAKFDSFKLLNRHILTEHRDVARNKLSKCKHCDERIRKKLMSKHVKSEHSPCKVEGCNKVLPLFFLRAHMLQEHGNNYANNLKDSIKKKKRKNVARKCPVTDCDQECKDNTDLRKHMQNNHTDEENLCPCKYEGCNQTLFPWAMKQHISKEHVMQKKQFEKECKICKIVCTSNIAWKKHRKWHIKQYFNQTNPTDNTEQNAENANKGDASVEDASDDESEESSDDDEPIEF